MVEHNDVGYSLPTQEESADKNMMRRPVRSNWQKFRETLLDETALTMSMIGGVAAMALVPQSWAVVIPTALGYGIWAYGGKYRLPFKIPIGWGGEDYAAPKPGGRGYTKAGGILYFGQDQRSKEELWVENGDARRHGFILGTTGSGKALPLDTPVLTPQGWRLNGDLRSGDQVIHPSGEISTVSSIHPQGAVRGARLAFGDGRPADCSLGHLWHVFVTSRADGRPAMDIPAEGRLMQADDLGLLHGMYGDKLRITIPRAMPYSGFVLDPTQDTLSRNDAQKAAQMGFAALDYMPSLYGTPAQRIAFLKHWVELSGVSKRIEKNGVRLKQVEINDARALKQIVWSLGGIASSHLRAGKKSRDRADVLMMFDAICDVWDEAAKCRFPNGAAGLEVTSVEPLDGLVEMSCIKTDREDGLYVMENHVVTHNTELLLGIVSQTLMWSSGFLFIDGKGTTEFYARAWSLCKRFGREDDLRVLNFTDPGEDPDAPAGGPGVQSNTLNPFAKGGADQLMNLIVGLMGDNGGKGGDMWQQRAMSLVTAAMKALVEMRNAGDVLLDVQTVRDFLPLGTGVSKDLLKGRKVNSIDDIPEEAWSEMRTRGGMIELYLRALKGDFSNASRLALKGFFDSLPGFILQKALSGDTQDGKTLDQYGFLTMQLTKPLGSLADDYGHIFRTPLGEVDIDDIVLNRRILIVLLPALQKAQAEMEMCGKIVVNLVKIMMGNASGSQLHGSKREIIEAKQTRAPSPFIVVLDEAGYYMVKGIDVMMAQARSLGFMIIVAGQDMAAMQSLNAQVAETAAANASIFAAGKTVDGDKTLNFIQRIFGKTHVAVTSGYSREEGVFSSKWVERQDASFQEVERVRLNELQNMQPGEFYFLFEGTIVRASTFYIGENFTDSFSVNKFVKVRGPMDRVPGLDQSVEEEFYEDAILAFETLSGRAEMNASVPDPIIPKDILNSVGARATTATLKAGKAGANPSRILDTWLQIILENASQGAGDVAQDDHLHDEDDDWNEDDDDLFDEPTLHGEAAERRHHSGTDMADSLSTVALGETSRQRHRGLIDVMIGEKHAREELAHVAKLKVPEPDEEDTQRAERSISDFFSVISQNAAQLSDIFAEEHIDGEIGLDILRKSSKSKPMRMPKIDNEDLVKKIDNLEKFFDGQDGDG